MDTAATEIFEGLTFSSTKKKTLAQEAILENQANKKEN
jgi:hypothetical protein